MVTKELRKLTKSARALPWVDKIPKVKVMAARSKVTGPKLHALAHLLLMYCPQAHIGHVGIYTLDTALSSIHNKVFKDSQVEGRSKVKGTGPKFHACAHPLYPSWVVPRS